MLKVLLLCGMLTIVVLTYYAISLLLRLKKQTKQQELHSALAIQKRNVNIIENVMTLCLVGLQEQCDYSELVIRLYNITDYLQGDERIDMVTDYPAISELYDTVKDMPRGEERQTLAKKARMKDNLVRTKAEVQLKEKIKKEMQQLHDRVKPLNQSLDVKVL